jgi:hypothetical protein
MNMTGRIDLREALDWAASNNDLLAAKWIELSGDEA